MFTYQKAMVVLPEIVELLKDAIDAKGARRKAEAAHAAYKKRLVMVGGAFPNQNRMAAYVDQAKTSYEAMKLAIDRIRDQGVEIRDLDQGLIDFPARYQGQPVYLCFQLGETAITHWHSAEEGLDGRKAINQEFIDQLDFS